MKKFLIISLIAFVPVILLILAFFLMPKYSLCSPVSGQIYFDKKPLAWVEVIRKSSSAWFDGNEIFIEKTVTDVDGGFNFQERQPNISFIRFFWWLPHDPYITQNIFVSHEWKEYSIFSWIKRTYETNSEIRYYTSVEKERIISWVNEKYTILESMNVPIKLTCDLEKTWWIHGYDRYPAWSGYENTSNFLGICTLN